MFLSKIAFRKSLLFGWVEKFVACYWCRWKVQDMTVRVVFFILKLVRKFLSDGELNTAWNREKISMSQGFARYWVTLLQYIFAAMHNFWRCKMVTLPKSTILAINTLGKM